MKQYILFIMILGVVPISTSIIAYADNTHNADHNTLQQLNIMDASASQGTLIYYTKSERLGSTISIDQRITQERERLSSSGYSPEQISEQLQLFRLGEQSEENLQGALYKETLNYLKDRRFLRTSTVNPRHGEVSTTLQMFDGQDELVITGDRKSVTIRPGKPVDLNNTSVMTSLYPGACFVLGRGLSMLQDTKVGTLNGVPQIEGVAPDGTRVKASLDPKHGYVATSIERTYQGKVCNKIVLGAPVLVDGQVWVASQAVNEAMSNGQPHLRNTYTLIKANFIKPDELLFHFPMRADMTIVDSRLGRPIVYESNTHANLTKEDLLPRTQKEIDRIANQLARDEATTSASKTKHNVFLALPLFIIGTIVFSYIFWKRRVHTS